MEVWTHWNNIAPLEHAFVCRYVKVIVFHSIGFLFVDFNFIIQHKPACNPFSTWFIRLRPRRITDILKPLQYSLRWLAMEAYTLSTNNMKMCVTKEKCQKNSKHTTNCNPEFEREDVQLWVARPTCQSWQMKIPPLSCTALTIGFQASTCSSV